MKRRNREKAPMSSSEIREKDSLKVDVRGKTEANPSHPERNGDAMVESSKKKFAGVFDGAGGHAAGDLASRIVARTFRERLEKIDDSLSTEKARMEIKKAFQKASEKIKEKIEKNPSKEGMGATATVVKVMETPEGKYAVYGHAGDTRLYLVRGERMQQVTEDDDLVSRIPDKKKRAKIRRRLDGFQSLSELDEEEENYFRRRNQITKAIGGSRRVKPKTGTFKVKEGDNLFLTSDGIHDNLTSREIAKILTQKNELHKKVKKLSSRAKEKMTERKRDRAKEDDMLVVAMSISLKKPQEELERKPRGGKMPASWWRRKLKEAVGSGNMNYPRECPKHRIGYDEAFNMFIKGATYRFPPEKGVDKVLEETDFTPTIKSCENFVELFVCIDEIGQIQGTQKSYSPQELKGTINKVREGELEIGHITRTLGLREKVIELLKSSKEMSPVSLIKSCENFVELFVCIDEIGQIQGTQKSYSPQELKGTINKVREGELEIGHITRTLGLREKVIELLRHSKR